MRRDGVPRDAVFLWGLKIGMFLQSTLFDCLVGCLVILGVGHT